MRKVGVFCLILYCGFSCSMRLGTAADAMTAAFVVPAYAVTGNSEYDDLEAELDTSQGRIVIEFFHADAPKHVEYFVKLARDGAYDGTTFHRLVKYGLIQGGDPLSKNPRDKARYGTGGLNAGLPDEVKAKHMAGAVSSVLAAVSGGSIEVKQGTSGQQFFIVLNAGPAQTNLDSKFSVFGRVVEGMDVAAAISSASATAAGMAAERIGITKVTIRQKTPTADQMKLMKAVIETSVGTVSLQLIPEAAPNATRQFVRYARSGFYDGTAFFRVSQKYFLEAGFPGDWPHDSQNRKRIFSMWPIPFEKNDVKQVRGTVSVRQSQDGTSGFYFFALVTDNPALDGKHAPVARVVEGLEVLDKIAAAEVEGDKPKQRIEIKKVTIQ
ncbi:MAG TPA: peptidylprolyl isomerase [Blastocatellia bacterium]|nr:peptidylprolyl isomerase [Blastocatellia bacterium]